RISYVPFDQMDEQMRAEMERCSREGTPRPESSAIRAHVPACFWFFARSWDQIFRHGVCDHRIKELCRVYISRSVNCEYCGNQRSVQAAARGLTEGKYDELLNFEKSDRYTEREKAALAYAEAIARAGSCAKACPARPGARPARTARASTARASTGRACTAPARSCRPSSRRARTPGTPPSRRRKWPGGGKP